MRFAATHLDTRDLPAIVDLLGRLHDAPTAHDVSHQLLTGLRGVTKCDLVSYNDIDVENPGTRTWFEPELVPRPELETAFDALQHEHPLVRDYAATGDPSPRRMSDFVALSSLHALDLWREVFRPLETNYQIAFAVLASRSRVIGLGINRWSRDFGERELAAAEVLQRLVPAAYDHARLRASARPRSSRLDVLSERELQVLELVAAGRTSAQIAQVLFVSRHTVNKHAENIRSKLGVHSRAEAAALYSPDHGAGEDTELPPPPG